MPGYQGEAFRRIPRVSQYGTYLLDRVITGFIRGHQHFYGSTYGEMTRRYGSAHLMRGSRYQQVISSSVLILSPPK